VPFHPDKVTQLIEDVVERYVIGWEPFKIESLWRILYSSGGLVPSFGSWGRIELATYSWLCSSRSPQFLVHLKTTNYQGRILMCHLDRKSNASGFDHLVHSL